MQTLLFTCVDIVYMYMYIWFMLADIPIILLFDIV